MTKREIANIASRMDEETKLLIEKEVAERLEILKEGDLSEDELSEMEECLYASLVLEEFLNGEYELLEEERQALFDEMEEMYNRYSDLLVRARIEEKVGKKKRMTLELMKIRERLMERKQDYKNIKKRMKDNRENHKKLTDLTSKDSIKELANKSKDYTKPVGRDKNYKPSKDKAGGLIGAARDALARGYAKEGSRDLAKEKDKEVNLRRGLRDGARTGTGLLDDFRSRPATDRSRNLTVDNFVETYNNVAQNIPSPGSNKNEQDNDNNRTSGLSGLQSSIGDDNKYSDMQIGNTRTI